jgi:hypothetical protein
MAAGSRDAQRTVVAHLSTSLRHPPDRVVQKQSDGRFPVLAICRGRLGVAGPSDLGELTLTHHDDQHDLAARASLAARGGT